MVAVVATPEIREADHYCELLVYGRFFTGLFDKLLIRNDSSYDGLKQVNYHGSQD